MPENLKSVATPSPGKKRGRNTATTAATATTTATANKRSNKNQGRRASVSSSNNHETVCDEHSRHGGGSGSGGGRSARHNKPAINVGYRKNSKSIGDSRSGSTDTSKDAQNLILHLRVTKEDQNRSILTTGTIHNDAMTENELLSYDPTLIVPSPYDQDANQHFSRPKQLTARRRGCKGDDDDDDHVANATVSATVGTTVGTTVSTIDTSSDERPHATRRTEHPLDDKTTFMSSSNPVALETHPSTACWWCCHSFTNTSYSLPVNKTNDGYNTIGCFCTPECVASYLFNNGDRFGDYFQMYTLLHEMVAKRHKNTITIPIKRAPPRETLMLFGGPYNITTFRELCGNYQKDVLTYIPPVKPVSMSFEETNVNYASSGVAATTSSKPLSNSDRVEKATKELRLRRAKRNTSENTLENFMKLRIIKDGKAT